MVVADLGTDHSGISNCILKSLGSTVQIVGAFLVGHVILVVGRKHGYQLPDTSVDLILAAGEVYKSCVLTLEFSGSGVTFGLVVAIQCVGGVYEKFCFLGLMKVKSVMPEPVLDLPPQVPNTAVICGIHQRQGSVSGRSHRKRSAHR